MSGVGILLQKTGAGQYFGVDKKCLNMFVICSFLKIYDLTSQRIYSE